MVMKITILEYVRVGSAIHYAILIYGPDYILRIMISSPIAGIWILLWLQVSLA
jgi:hypothetical protein